MSNTWYDSMKVHQNSVFASSFYLGDLTTVRVLSTGGGGGGKLPSPEKFS